jgi:hypothetical protein
MRRLLSLVAASLVTLALAACMTPAQQKEDNLVRNANELADNIRWQRWDHVIAYMTRQEATLFVQRANQIGEDLVMADKEVTSIDFVPGGEKAHVLVTFTWYSQRNPVVKKTVLEQTWEYKGSRWLLTQQYRIRGDRLLLVPERMVPADGGATVPDGGVG